MGMQIRQETDMVMGPPRPPPPKKKKKLLELVRYTQPHIFAATCAEQVDQPECLRLLLELRTDVNASNEAWG